MKCNLCPRSCMVDRSLKTGFCNAPDKIRIARAALHHWEEPCISGENGSGTVFFSFCPLKCVYCQNYKLSHDNIGREITTYELADIFLDLQSQNAHNINLVTPTHYVPRIIEALNIAKKSGLTIPIVYNTSGYESVDTLKMLSGYVDIYLPDFKYYSNELSKKYSLAPNYFEIATKALEEMFNQVGEFSFDENGMMKKGMIIRHLILPNQIEDSKNVISHVYNLFKDKIYISIMNQYTPLPHVSKYPELNRKITEDEYDEVVNFAISLGIENAFIQEGDTAKESFIPDFH